MLPILSISPHGRPFLDAAPADAVAPAPSAADDAAAKRIDAAFARSPWHGLLHLAMAELQTPLPAGLSFARDFGRTYLTRLCQTPGLEGAPEGATEASAVAPPTPEELAETALQAPPMKGTEYLSGDVLATWWAELDDHV